MCRTCLNSFIGTLSHSKGILLGLLKSLHQVFGRKTPMGQHFFRCRFILTNFRNFSWKLINTSKSPQLQFIFKHLYCILAPKKLISLVKKLNFSFKKLKISFKKYIFHWKIITNYWSQTYLKSRFCMLMSFLNKIITLSVIIFRALGWKTVNSLYILFKKFYWYCFYFKKITFFAIWMTSLMSNFSLS